MQVDNRKDTLAEDPHARGKRIVISQHPPSRVQSHPAGRVQDIDVYCQRIESRQSIGYQREI